RVVGAQDLEHLGPAEFRRNRASLGKPFAELRTRNEQAVGVVMRTGSSRRHAAALVAPERPIDLGRPDLQRISRNFIEDVMSVERTVVAADARMVASDDQM